MNLVMKYFKFISHCINLIIPSPDLYNCDKLPVFFFQTITVIRMKLFHYRHNLARTIKAIFTNDNTVWDTTTDP